ncbi:uncharacterized protein LOC118439161 [Folsomia candida]|uniref:NACHT domain-containing protein n=1 Tax=Folsomia candida TaxID=158441 RepID=A0A226D6W1_FOLCA|nr:uncharacterized protein LOC118439161 [Folsomia candida]OXA40883.1 hypothetical protein Fcan01_24258 [Folsomia candida]
MGAVEKLQKDTSDPPPLQHIITGHSLGGWLAQVATYAVKYLKLSASSFVPYNGDRYHPHCVVFDSPGTRQMLDYIHSCSKFGQHLDFHTVRLEICNYVLYPNFVNVTNPPFGDMVQISSEQITGAFEEFDPLKDTLISHLSHVGRFHRIDLFVKILNGGNPFRQKAIPLTKPSLFKKSIKIVKRSLQFIKNSLSSSVFGDTDVNLDMRLNGDVSYQVVKWPFVVFQGWNTKVDKAMNSWVNLIWNGISPVLDKNARRRLSEWVSRADIHCGSISTKDDEVSLSTTRLSETEKKITEQFKRIRLWKKYIRHDKVHKICSPELKPIFDNIDKFSAEMGRISFKNQETYKLIKNCCSFNLQTELRNGIKNLPDYDFTSVLLESESFCDEMLNKYCGVKFTRTDPLKRYNVNKNTATILTSTSKDLLTLTLLKFIFLKHNGFNAALKTALILKYDSKNKKSRPKLEIKLSGITLIIINCIDVSDDEIHKFSSNPSIKYVWLRQCTYIKQTVTQDSDEPSPKRKRMITPNSFELANFEVDTDLLECLLSKEICLQGHPRLLRDVIHDKQDEFKEFLKSSPSTILSILEGSQEKIGHTPKSVFSLKSSYFEIARNMNSAELVGYYSRELTKYETIVVFECNKEDYLHQQGVLEPLCQTKIRIIILPANSFVEFQSICTSEPDCVVDHVRCSDDFNVNQPFHRVLQYIPNFYIKRKINKPGIDLEAACNYLKFEMDKKCYIGHNFKVEIHKNDSQNATNSSCKSLFPKLKKRGSMRFVSRNNSYIGVAGDVHKTEFAFANVEVHEDDLPLDNRFIIFSDEPGMGKSTTVVKLANRILQQNAKRSNMHFLIVIELKTLENIELSDTDFVSSFVNCISANQKFNEFSKFILRNFILLGNMVTIIADGFDEMTIENNKLWTNVLLQIRKQTKIRIIITTRRHDSDLLQSTLCVLEHTFVPLRDSKSVEENEKIQFLVNLWSTAIRCTNEQTSELTLLTKFATQVILEAHSHLVQGRENFLGVPLQLRILSEIFLDNAIDYVVSEGKKGAIEDLREVISLSYIYQKFIDRKYHIYLSQKNGLPNSSVADRHVSARLDEYMYKIAVEIINCSEDYDSLITRVCGRKLLCPDKMVVDDIIRLGIAYEDKGAKNLQFIHRTFAEFYVAKFLASEIDRLSHHGNNSFEEDAKLLTNILLQREPANHFALFSFLDDMIKARLAQGLGYANFPKFKDSNRRLQRDLKLSQDLSHVGGRYFYLEDFLIKVVNRSDIDFAFILKESKFGILHGYVCGVEPLAWMVSFLRTMLKPKVAFRKMKWLNFYYTDYSPKVVKLLDCGVGSVELLSINDMIQKFDKLENSDGDLKTCILHNPIAYLVFTDESRDTFFNLIENCVRRSPDHVELQHSDRDNISTIRNRWEASIDGDLVRLIEDRSGLEFSKKRTMLRI